MKKDVENVTLSDAIATIKHHFTELGGLLWQLEQGEKVDERAVSTIQTSLLRIRIEWSHEQRIPKDIIMLFIASVSRLDQYSRIYKDRLREITDFSIKLTSWINDIFSTESMTEEQALSLLVQHTFGTPPFVIELRQHRINDASTTELIESLETLSVFWTGKKDVPKLAAHALFNIKDLVINAKYIFSGKNLEKIENVEEKIDSLIEKCLT